ncbi:hypothetical protein Mame_04515 (plasmid) [Martelella mediterranea DSM 17316]|uniref:Uncharacterized protein n=2 Tax=Martelella mediterranea TaxID=293089 RepID=A0A1U9Z7W7_9HYPH|nr:hypothetical protein Mame_04515 [Martelella mediterranea DSM 17316]
MFQQFVRDISATLTQMGDGPAEIDRVPTHDGTDHEIEAGCPERLTVKGAIEFKNCNISAALIGFGLPYIGGYQPRFNFQMALAEAVSRWLARNPSFETASAAEMHPGFAEAPPLFFGVPPTMQNAPPPAELSQIEAIARRFDVAGRDERNRSLGKAREERVFHHERAHCRFAFETGTRALSVFKDLRETEV